MTQSDTTKTDAASAWQVPYQRNVHFTGRDDELADLRKSLVANDPARRVQAICGLGGSGKRSSRSNTFIATASITRSSGG